MEPLISADDAIAVLNRIHAADPTVLQALVAYRVSCNQALTDDPTVQVGRASTFDMGAEGYVVGLLGIINGLFGTDDRGYGPITAHYDDAGTLDHFERTTHA